MDMQSNVLKQNMLDCFQNIFQAVLKRRTQRAAQPDNPDRVPPAELMHLAHYTTAEGLHGIVEQGCLRAGAAYYLNDSSEIDYGCNLFTSILKESIGKTKMDDMGAAIVQHTQKAFEPSGSMESVASRTYVACFCEDPNLLSQWRAYGQDGGYSVGFRRQALQTEFKVEDQLFQVELRRIIYDKESQIKLLDGVLSDVLSALGEPEVKASFEKLDGEEKKVFFISFNMFLQATALAEIVRFKHPAFTDEQEWRLVARPKSPFLSQGEILQLKFRPSRGMVVPYLELRPKNGDLLPIDYVRYGPTLEKKRAENSLDLLFKQKGYPEVKFYGSDIPVILP